MIIAKCALKQLHECALKQLHEFALKQHHECALKQLQQVAKLVSCQIFGTGSPSPDWRSTYLPDANIIS